MNIWVEKSMDLAKKSNYLDNLAAVYPLNVVIPPKSKKAKNNYTKIRIAFKQKNKKELLSGLLEFKRFPIDDPYVGFFRKDESAIERNPQTVKRITDDLFKIGMRKMISGIERKKSASRQFGQLFRNYIKNLGYPVVLDKEKFIQTKKKIAFLDGGDQFLKGFAKKELGYRGEKGIDMVLKVKDKFYIGETKFISVKGGTQDKSFREAISFVKKSSKTAQHIVILDGILWLNDKKKGNLYSQLFTLKANQVAVSSLLLKDFIESL